MGPVLSMSDDEVLVAFLPTIIKFHQLQLDLNS